MLLLGFFYLTRYLNVYIPINFYLFTVTQQPLWGQPWLAGWGISSWGGWAVLGEPGGLETRGGVRPRDCVLEEVLSPVLGGLPQWSAAIKRA